MKILLISPRRTSARGAPRYAAEAAIRSRKNGLERLGHVVDVAHARDAHDVISEANRRRYDFVHVHDDGIVLECVEHLTCPFAVTIQNAGLHAFDPQGPETSASLRLLFEDTLRAPANIVPSRRIRQLYLRSGYRGVLGVLPAGVDTDTVSWRSAGNGRALCVEPVGLPRDGWLAAAVRDRVAMDIVGRCTARTAAAVRRSQSVRYLGTWREPSLYESLTEYSCLAILDDPEAAMHIVPAALAAGLSLVVGDACASDLTEQPFITVLPAHEQRGDAVAAAIQHAIDTNAALRGDIRQYAERRFDYRKVILPEYVPIIYEVRQYFADGQVLIAPWGGQPRDGAWPKREHDCLWIGG
jgi:hypothetical protein